MNVLNSPKHNYSFNDFHFQCVWVYVWVILTFVVMCSKDKRCIVGDRFIATLEELISPSLPSTSQAYGQCFSRCFALDHITKFINMYFFFRYEREARDWSTKLFFFHRSFPLVKPCNRVPVPHLILDASNKIKKYSSSKFLYWKLSLYYLWSISFPLSYLGRGCWYSCNIVLL